MKLLSQEVVDRLRDKIPEIKNLKGVDPYIYGMTHLDIVDEDNKVIKQMVILIERSQVLEPETFFEIENIYADVYVRISDKILYEIAIKEISIDDALEQKLFRARGDQELWKYQLEALRSIIPKEEFAIVEIESETEETMDEIKEEEIQLEMNEEIQPEVNEQKPEEVRRKMKKILPPRNDIAQMKVINDVFMKIVAKNSKIKFPSKS